MSKQPRVIRPAVDLYEDADGLILIADLPGVPKEALELRVDKGILDLEGVRGDLVYRRRFELPPNIDTEAIGARLEAGVLEVTLPRAAAFKPRQITVQ